MTPTLEKCLAGRQDNFLLLRFLAASLVIYAHASAITGGAGPADVGAALLGVYSGTLAVDVFFITSGFMVAASYVRNPRPLQFALARVLRIVPAYAVCIVLCALVVGALYTSLDWRTYFSHPETWSFITRGLTFGPGLQWDLPGVFVDSPKRTTVNGSLWTIPAEVRMYVWVLALGMLGLLSRRALGNVALLVLVAAGALVPEQLPGFPVPNWLRPGGMFALGVFAFLNRDWLRASGRQLLVVAAAAWLFRNTVWYPPLLALAIGAFVFWFAYRTPWRGFNRFGDMSYGIYLWGFPVQQMVAVHLPELGTLAHTAVALPFAILLGALSWRFIEKPALVFKGAFAGPRVGAADEPLPRS
jgi:peptidoglycan/LPS O-acetylase OafA/YrhL